MCCFFEWYGDNRNLHVLTNAFPTRRSSDLWSLLGNGRRQGVEQAGLLDMRAVHPVRNGPQGQRAGGIGAQEPQRLLRIDRHLAQPRSEEHTSELQSLMRISYAVFCLKKKTYKLQDDIYR